MGFKYPFLYKTIDINDKITKTKVQAFGVRKIKGIDMVCIINLKQYIYLKLLLIFNFIQNHLLRFRRPKSYNILNG